MAARIWTLEQRRRQAEAIERWKPWEQSTGPLSAAGKAKVARNADGNVEAVRLKAVVRELIRLLEEQKSLLSRR